MSAFHSFSTCILSAMLALGSITPASRVTIILLVDNSGSMKASDPSGLRYTAINMLAALLDDTDQLGVIGFSTTSQMLTDGLISPPQYKTIQPVAPDGYTDIKSALTKAARLLAQAGKVKIILLTDGKPEMEHPYPTYEQETIALAHSLGVPIYAIALTPNADSPFLQRLTAGTGGAVFPAKAASDLLDVYLQVFNAMQDRTVIGQGAASASGSVSFEIDPALAPYLEKVSFVMGKPENVHVYLVSPDGQNLSPDMGFARNSDPRFVAVTVKHPQGGVWKFVTTGAGQVRARAILYSRLRVQIISPSGFQELGQPIPIVTRLIEERENGEMVKIIGSVTFSAEILRPDGKTESLDRLYDDGTHGDQTANDGDYTRLYVGAASQGPYQITVTGYKGAVPATQQSQVEVVAFPKFVLDTPQTDYEIRAQPILLKVYLTSSLEHGEVLARITAPSGQQDSVPLTDRDGVYTGAFIPAENGSYTIQFETYKAVYLSVPFHQTATEQFTVRLVHLLDVGPPEIQVTNGCFEGAAQVSVRLPVSSIRQETVHLKLPGLVLQPASFTLQPGPQQLVFEIFASGGEFVSGANHANLQIDALTGVDIQPSAVIPLNFSIPSPLERCQRPIAWGGFGLLGILLAGLWITRKIRIAAAPPLASGTLRWWAGNLPNAELRECDLTALARSSIRIGSKPDCDLRIGELADYHAILLAEKTDGKIAIYLQPVGMVRKGYVVLRNRALLEHVDQFNIGGLNFQYISDSGE